MGLYKIPVRSDELYHFGIKGMHWGVRRYQNADGSLTAAGRKRYDVGEARKKKKIDKTKVKTAAMVGAGVGLGASSIAALNKVGNKDRIYEQNIKKGKNKLSVAEVLTGENAKSIDATSKMFRTIGKVQKENAKNMPNKELEERLKTMSDDELRKTINRINMERQYRDLNTLDIQTGADRVADVLDVAGGVASIAASMAIVGTALYKIKH